MLDEHLSLRALAVARAAATTIAYTRDTQYVLDHTFLEGLTPEESDRSYEVVGKLERDSISSCYRLGEPPLARAREISHNLNNILSLLPRLAKPGEEDEMRDSKNGDTYKELLSAIRDYVWEPTI
jgi:hypothetical protein